MRSPHKTARALLALVVCSTVFADYWEYSKQWHANPDAWMDVVRGTAPAPQQYRVGVVRLADLLRRHAHIGLRHAFTLIDLVCAAVAVFLLFSMFERTKAYRSASDAMRWFGAAAFVFLVQYCFAWIAWYQKPETMASAAVLAATVWLLTVRLPLGKAASLLVVSSAMLVLAGVQGFIRADVAVAVHAGIFLVCLTRAGDGFSLPRAMQAATSLLAVVLAGGIQLCLMHVVYPHASYGTTPVIQIGLNVTQPLRWIPFALFMAPAVWLAASMVRRRWMPAEAWGKALAAGSAIYAVLWFAVGKIDEVRIFLPYALALIPLACVCAMERANALAE